MNEKQMTCFNELKEISESYRVITNKLYDDLDLLSDVWSDEKKKKILMLKGSMVNDIEDIQQYFNRIFL